MAKAKKRRTRGSVLRAVLQAGDALPRAVKLGEQLNKELDDISPEIARQLIGELLCDPRGLRRPTWNDPVEDPAEAKEA